MMGHVSVNAIAPRLFTNLHYDVTKDFAPIAHRRRGPALRDRTSVRCIPNR